MKLQHPVTVPTPHASSARPATLALALAIAGMSAACTPPRLALRAESARALKARPMKVVPWGTMDPLELGGGIAISAAF